MSKPNKEQIDYARQLKELGVEKPPEVGDWYIPGGEGHEYCWLVEYTGEVAENPKNLIIPPLDWCLERLREKDPSISIVAVTQGWVVMGESIYVSGDTARDAALKAMLEVAKEGE